MASSAVLSSLLSVTNLITDLDYVRVMDPHTASHSNPCQGNTMFLSGSACYSDLYGPADVQSLGIILIALGGSPDP